MIAALKALRAVGCPLPSQLGDLGEHRKLPQWVQGRAAAQNGFGAF